MIKLSNVTDNEISQAFAGTNFGHSQYKELLAASVFKKLVGYHCGHSITKIMKELRLIGISEEPTERGRIFVREQFGYLMAIGGQPMKDAMIEAHQEPVDIVSDNDISEVVPKPPQARRANSLGR